jgi:acid stress chaperone HdeB
MHRGFAVLGATLVLALSWVATGQAQVTIDASRITCDQFVHSKIAPTRTIAAWLAGFYSGKRDSQVIDTQTFEANLSILLRRKKFQNSGHAGNREAIRQ